MNLIVKNVSSFRGIITFSTDFILYKANEHETDFFLFVLFCMSVDPTVTQVLYIKFHAFSFCLSAAQTNSLDLIFVLSNSFPNSFYKSNFMLFKL